MSKKRPGDDVVPLTIVPLSRLKAKLDADSRATPIDTGIIEPTQLHPNVPSNLKAAVRSMTGQLFVLRPHETALIGRSPTADIVINHALTSRWHCSIIMHGDGLRISNMSRFGTFVNGTRVSETRLVHDDMITLGADDSLPTLMTVQIG